MATGGCIRFNYILIVSNDDLEFVRRTALNADIAEAAGGIGDDAADLQQGIYS